jgi:hypothetical protein
VWMLWPTSHNFGSELVRDLMAWRVAMRSATLGR